VFWKLTNIHSLNKKTDQKMKAKLLFTALMLFCGITAQAQSDVLTATLTHNGIHTTYTGRDCLTDALAASADGDVVALSAGNFSHNSYTITKPITLRGAGDGNTVHPSTELKYLTISIPEYKNGMMVLEGIMFIDNKYTDYTLTWKVTDLQIRNCTFMRDCCLYLYAKQQGYLYKSTFNDDIIIRPNSSQANFHVQQCHGTFWLDKYKGIYTINFINSTGLLYQKADCVTALFNHSGSGIQSCRQIFIFLPGDIGLPLFPYQTSAPLNCQYEMTVSNSPDTDFRLQ